MNRTTQITLTVVSFLLGLLLVTQYHTQRQISAGAVTQSSADQAVIISGLVQGNAQLRTEVQALQASLLASEQATGQGNLEAMVTDLNRLRAVNGLVEVAGPGVEVTLDGSVTALDLQDLVNEARNAGAEALALNGHRLVARSVLVGSEGAIVLDGLRLTAPYRLQAVGPAESLERALTRKGGLLALLQYAYPDAMITVAQRPRLVLPLYAGKYEFRYAR